MYFMSDPQALHVTRNVIPGKLGVDLHLHRVHIPLVEKLLRGPEIRKLGHARLWVVLWSLRRESLSLIHVCTKLKRIQIQILFKSY